MEAYSGTTSMQSSELKEAQMIALAIDLAERQLIEGTASSQVIVHYLKLATERERNENNKLREEVELLRAKTKAIEADQNREELYLKAIEAMQSYSGAFDA